MATSNFKEKEKPKKDEINILAITENQEKDELYYKQLDMPKQIEEIDKKVEQD